MVVRQKFSVKGSVKKVRLVNFMTYVDEVFWPGPGFNVMVGPNGSGKSSVVTALCVGLGGDVDLLNRQVDLQCLVNTASQCNEALVEVELYVPDNNENLHVSCKIFKDNPRPTFHINQKMVSKSELVQLVSDLQIQPGNMCQFLPQDVVRDFPNMTNQQIFHNTVKAVGDTTLIETHEKLKSIQSNLKKLNIQYETKFGTLQNLERKKSRLDDDMQAYEKRKSFEERKKTIQNAILWEKFKAKRKQVKETRDKERNLKATLDTIEQKQKPIRDFLQSYQVKVDQMQRRTEAADKEHLEWISKVEEFDIADTEDSIERLAEQEKDLVQQEEDRVAGKAKISKEIRELEHHLANKKPDPQLDLKIKGLIDKKSVQETSFQRNNQNLIKLQCDIETLRGDKVKIQKSYNELQDKKTRKLEILRRENPDTYEGVIWLRQNLTKFKAPVHEPIMLSIDVKNRDLAKYVETHIGKADLEGFVCEDPDDVNRLTKQLREVKNLKRINAFHSNPDPPSRFSHKVSREELSKYDLVDYISDMYTAPNAVHAYLCRQKGLHQVPVFRQENEMSADLKSKFTNYYIGNQKFNSKKSKYSGELSTGMEDIAGRKVIRLAATVDTVRADSLRADLLKKEEEIISHEKRKELVEATCGNIRVEIGKTDEAINKLKAEKREFSSKQSELEMKRRTLQQIMKPKFNLQVEIQKLKTEKAKLTLELSKQITEHSKMVQESSKAESKRKILHLAFQNLESENSENSEKMAALDREFSVAKSEHDAVNLDWERDKKALQARHAEAKSATGVLSNDIKYKPPEVWQAKFDALGTSDVNVLAAFLDECDSELKYLKKIDDKTVSNIEEISAKLSAAQDQVNSLDSEIANNKHEAHRLKSRWMKGVQDLVEKVNEKFSRMMAEMGYNGQISLSEGDKETQFAGYGIKIQVRFREGESLQELSKGTQSGGEKSVTTALYMMALQELTKVPFRCVDEINQGMDERNERAVWGMLLDVCKDHQAQYFYMAPKFPSSLPFNSQVEVSSTELLTDTYLQVTMLICNNGRVRKRKSLYDTSNFIEKAKRMKSR